MTSHIGISLEPSVAKGFIRALLLNLERPDASSVLEWIKDSNGGFHTRIHYATTPVHIGTDESGSLFSSMCILSQTSSLEPENSDLLEAVISREELGADMSMADQLVKKLNDFTSPYAHDVTRILKKFSLENS